MLRCETSCSNDPFAATVLHVRVPYTPILSTGKYYKNINIWIPIVAQRVKNLTSIQEDAGSIPCLIQWVKDLMLP